MGLFKDYNVIPPVEFPCDWLSRSESHSESYFKIFCTKDIEVPELKRVKKLLEKKSAQDFINPIITKGYYKIVESMTLNELENMPDLSGQEHKSKFFGLMKNKETKFKFQNKDVIPHKLKEFAKMILPEKIQFLEPSEKIDDDVKIIKTCTYCDRGKINRGMYDQVQIQTRTEIQTPNGSLPVFGTNTVRRNLESKCPTCDGKWKTGFKFKDFAKYVKKFNEKIMKLNEEISDINEKSHIIVEEYNKLTEKLNEKILIWNSKCPYNAIDDDHKSDNDFLKFWGCSR